ncbi:hypothetical protein HU175_21965 [Spirosoma sp. KUDC1026]|nr:hypothetical protein HU175_21965 [Spirosoma sp. KUDC1026]
MRHGFFLFLFFVLTRSGLAQQRIDNVRIRVTDSLELEVRYDLLEARPGDSIYLQVRSRLRGELFILPRFLRGDVGKRVLAGSDRRIVWNVLGNSYSLNEDIQATVLIKSPPPPPNLPKGKSRQEADQPGVAVGNRQRYAGPAWALLSVVAPGVGNMFVQTPRPRIGLRPLITLGCYGLIGYGLMERQKSLDVYDNYLDQKNIRAGEPYYQEANRHHQRYYLATRGAVLVTAIDVVLTFVRGLRNSRQPNQVSGLVLRPGLQAGQPTAVMTYSF